MVVRSKAVPDKGAHVLRGCVLMSMACQGLRKSVMFVCVKITRVFLLVSSTRVLIWKVSQFLRLKFLYSRSYSIDSNNGNSGGSIGWGFSLNDSQGSFDIMLLKSVRRTGIRMSCVLN